MTTARFTPDYLKDYTVYQLSLKTFTPEGTLNAAAKLLPHLAEIGVDLVAISPVTLAAENPYLATDFNALDPQYGTDEDLAAFVSIAHQLGLSIIMEQNLTSCDERAPFLKDFPQAVQTRDGIRKFNSADMELAKYLGECMVAFVEDFGFDGYKFLHADSMEIEFWDMVRSFLDSSNPELIVIAETDCPDGMEELFDVAESNQWIEAVNQVFDGKKPATHVQKTWQKQHDDMPQDAFILRTFDDIHIADKDGKNRPEARRALEANDAALLLNFTLDGIPQILQGQEVADDAPLQSCGNHTGVNWAKLLTTEGQARLEFFKKLADLRHETNTLNDGFLTWVDNSTPEQIVSFLRTPFDMEDEDLMDDEECECGCRQEDGQEHECHCHEEGHQCTCHHHDEDGCGCEDDMEDEDEDYEDEDYEDEECDCDDDDCDCGDHEHGHASNVLVAVNTSDRPVASTLGLALERGTLLNVKMIKGATYKPSGDHLDVCLLPYGFLVIEF